MHNTHLTYVPRIRPQIPPGWGGSRAHGERGGCSGVLYVLLFYATLDPFPTMLTKITLMYRLFQIQLEAF